MTSNHVPSVAAFAVLLSALVVVLARDPLFRRAVWELTRSVFFPLIVGISVSLILSLGWLISIDGRLWP